MEAIAHSPSFAKKAGVPQSVGKDYAAADKGKKFAGGGKAVINKQDTKHGKMDMPFNKLNRFAGMKAGGMMKKGRRFDTGGDVNDRLGEVGETKPRKKMSFASRFAMERGLGNKTFTYNGKEYTTELAKPKVDSRPFEKVPLNTAAIERRAKILSTGPNYEAAPRGAAVTRDEAMEERRAAQNTAAPGGSAPLADTMKRGGKVKRFAKGGVMAKGVEKQLPTSKQMGNLNMKAGGMKESKAMVGKEVDFMKKKGAPVSMIKHEAAEMGAMKKGGMAKYAKGGGIESRGKTKGTVIKMATGGVVKFAKGGGIESKGKTKGTMIKMQGC
jgi:hypothetical protein